MNSRIDNVADTTKGSKIDSHFRRGMRPSNPIIVWLGLVAYLVLVAVLLKCLSVNSHVAQNVGAGELHQS
jgi:hypothetical protein